MPVFDSKASWKVNLMQNGALSEFTMMHELIYQLKVRDTMTSRVITATPEDSLRHVQLLMKQNRISGVPIIQDGGLAGIVSLEDIINALEGGYITEPVDKWMTRNVVVIQENMSLVLAVQKLESKHFGRLPVVNEVGELTGILTLGDVTKRLMFELNRLAEETASREAQLMAEVDGFREGHDELIFEADITSGDFDNAGLISGQIKQELKQIDVEPEIIRRAAIAIYEAETNLIIHSIGGKIIVRMLREKLHAEALDWGPGIPDIEKAMEPGYSTASQVVRAMGFGAGLGLQNIKKCVDRFEIHSTEGVGTNLIMEIDLSPAEGDANERI